MAFTHITPADLSGKGVVGLPDTPQLSALAMQQKFDEIATDVIVPKFNDLADELDTGAGAIMNVTDPTSGTTDTLQNTLDHIETENALNTADRHNHANKATLDDIDATVKAAYDRLVTLLGAITGIQSVLSSSTAELPDAKAVADAIATVQAEVSLNTAARHTHVNKATLDDITALVKQGYDDLVTLLTGITGIETTLTNANNKIPRSDAVYTAVDNLSAIVAANTAARHTHANKATLDAIDATTKTAYDGLVTLFTGITSVSSSVTDDTVSIPNGHAIVDYVSSLGGGDMLKATYDTNDDGTVDSADYATNAGHATTADSATSATSAASATYATSAGSATSATTATSATNADYATSAGDSSKLGGKYSSFYAEAGDLQTLFGDVATYQSTSTALRNYAVGDFMIYENNFYEVTQAIASGGTIVKNTNVTKKTIGEVLTTLASATPADMTGATSLLPGTHGLVPAPQAGDEDKVLRGDGTWGSAGDTATVRYVPLTDMVQCWDGTQWKDWKTAGLNLNPLYNNGVLCSYLSPLTALNKDVAYINQASQCTYLRNEDNKLCARAQGNNASGVTGKITFILSPALDLAQLSQTYTKLRFTGYIHDVNSLTIPGYTITSCNAEVGLYDVNGDSIVYASENSHYDTPHAFVDDVALPSSGVGYIGVKLYRASDLGTRVIGLDISKIELV